MNISTAPQVEILRKLLPTERRDSNSKFTPAAEVFTEKSDFGFITIK